MSLLSCVTTSPITGRRKGSCRCTAPLLVMLAVLIAAPGAWAQVDWGDAPDPNYPTLNASTGARHTIGGPFMGTAPDGEADGQPNATATGDDTDGNDDEDGAVFSTALITGETAGISVTASVAAKLDAWVDFNADGDWADANELISPAGGWSLAAGANPLTFGVPAGAVVGATFARFRISTAGGLAATGLAPDGEVEDYQVEILNADLGDAPDSYDTLRASGGPRHGIDGTGPHLGTAAPDADSDGFGDGTDDNGDATDDDTEGATPDDEDGFTPGSLFRGDSPSLSVTVTTSGAAYLDAWIDFNADGDFGDALEKITSAQSVSNGANTVSGFQVPWDAAIGNTYARFRVSTSSGGLTPGGLADDGEVEDYRVEIRGLDFGDAPDPSYPTLRANNGARHAVPASPAVYLGATAPDVELDGQQSVAATGDDTNGSDDEDGVTFAAPLVPGQTGSVDVVAVGAGSLNAWIDFNSDGDWNDSGSGWSEQIFTDHALTAGPHALTFSVPTVAQGTVSATTTFARFRYSTGTGLSPTGLATNGEVEDLTVDIAPVADLAVTKTADVVSAVPGQTRVTYTVTVTNNGPDDVTGATVTDSFGSDLVGVIWTCEITSGIGSCGLLGGAGDIDTTVDLENGAVATFVAKAWVAPGADGVTCGSDRCLSNTASVAPPSGTDDPTPGNDSATDETPVLEPTADLAVDKDNGLNRLSPGDLFPYTIRVSNPGPSSANEVTVTDAFPVAKLEAHTVECSPGASEPCWQCDPAPSLDHVETLVEGEGTVSGLEGASAATVSPDGAHVYATGSVDDAVAAFARDAATGELTWLQVKTDGETQGVLTVDGLDGAAAVAVSPDGGHVYVASTVDGAVSVFARDAVSGLLTYVEDERDGSGGVDYLAGATALAVSPDGAHVYVAASGDDAVTVFSRDPASGQLTYIEEERDGTGGVDYLAGATAVVVSPDGAHVYVAASGDSAVTAFARDPASGELTYVEEERDGAGGADRLAGAAAVAISPDGADVYVVADVDDSVSWFSRTPSTGALSYQGDWVDGTGGVNGLDGATAVAVHPNGSLVVVAASADSGLAVFSRDVATGALTFADWFNDPNYVGTGAAAAVTGLGAAGSVAVSPDGDHVLATGKTVPKDSPNAVVVLTVSAGAECPDPAKDEGDLGHVVGVPAGSWVEFTAWCRVRDDASGSVENWASIVVDEPADLVDGNGANDSDPDVDAIGLEVDIDVVKTATLTEAVPGEPLGYSIIVTNHGPQNVSGVTAVDDFDIYDGATVLAGFDALANIHWTCAAGTGGACVDAAGDGNISALVDLTAGGSVTFTVTGVVHSWSVGTLSNAASATLPVDYADTDPGNDVGVANTPVTPIAGIAVTKDHVAPPPPDSIDPGEEFQYVIVVANSGPSAAQGIMVQDVFSGDLAGVTWTCATTGSGSQCQSAGPTAGDINHWVTLAPLGTATFTVMAVVDPTAEGTLLNTVTVDSGNATDPDPANNVDDDEIMLTAWADLAITKDDGRTEAVPGLPITYTITATNRGTGEYSDDVYGATVVDIFPPELVDVSWTCDPTPPIPGELTFLQLNTLTLRLDGAADVTVSPDGAHVYAVGADGDAVVAYGRVTELGGNFGKLTTAPIDVHQRDASDPDPAEWLLPELDQPRAVVVSPGGAHVYVAAATGNAVLVFERDWMAASEDFGKLTFVESVIDGDGGVVDGLAGAADLVLSPDGEFLYVTGAADNAVAVLDRNPATGRLTFVEVIIDGAGGVDGLAGAAAMTMSPGGAHLYVAGPADDAVAWFSRDPASGALTFADVYLDGAGGVDGLAGAASVIVSPDGAQVYVAGAADDALATFQRDNDDGSGTFGALTFDVAITAAAVEGLDGARVLALPVDLSDPDDQGEHVLAGGDPAGKLVLFRRNVITGSLSFQEVLREGQPVFPPELTVHGLEVVAGIGVSPDGRHVYTASDLDGAVTVFDRRQPDAAFAFVEAEIDGQDDGFGTTVDGLYAARSVTVSGDGDHVYVAGFGDDSVAVFFRQPDMGTTPDTRGEHLYFVDSYYDGEIQGSSTIDGLDGAASVVMSPDNRHLYVAGESDSAVAVFERDTTTGELTFVEAEVDGVGGADGLAGAVGLAISPAGGGSSHLYVAGQYEAAVAVFERNPADGTLSFVERKSNGIDGVEGLDGVSALVVSPDRRHLYAVSRIDDAIAVFERSQTDGTLSFLQVLRDGVGAEGLDQALSVAISPDGAHVYVTGANDDALAVFERNTDETSDQFGRVDFVEAITDGSLLGGRTVDGLAGARAVAVGAAGLRVFVAGEHDGALTVFSRVADETSLEFGSLTFMEVRLDGVDGVEGVNQAYGVAVSLSDNSHVYVAGLGDNALAAFVARTGSSCTPSGSGDIVDQVDIGWGGSVTYTVQARIVPQASGSLTNEARILPPARTTDPDLLDDPDPLPGDNNLAVDVDTLTPESDLAVNKSDGTLSAVAGEELVYTIAVTNSGPSHAVGARVVDDDIDPADPGSHFADASWTCLAIGSGSLQILQVVKDGGSIGTPAVTVDGLDGASAVAVSPDGFSVYATGLVDDAVVVFDRDPSTGELMLVEVVNNGDDHGGVPVAGLGGASDVAVIDDGAVQTVYVTGQVDDAIAVFDRNPADGTLTFLHALVNGIGGVSGLDQAVAVVASPDGGNVYVAGSNDDAIVVFDRQANGSLTFVGTVDDPAYGLDGVSDLAISPDPDGAGSLASYLYATGFNSGTVVVFSRGAGGALTFVEKKGAGTSSYLAGAKALALDADSSHLYVAGSVEGALVVLGRSALNGSLNKEQEIVAGVNGVSGLANVAALVVSADGAHLYAAGQGDDAVVLFSRDLSDGSLTYVEEARDGVGGVDGINGVTALALSPDGRQLYAAGLADDAIAVFERPLDSSCTASGSGPIDDIVNVAAGGSLRYEVRATVRPDAVGTACPDPLDDSRMCVVNEVTVAPGPTAIFSDPEAGNNSDVDADYLGRRANLSISKTDQFAEHEGLLGPVAVAVDPAWGEHVYVAGAGESALAIFDRNPGDGTVAFVGVVRDDEDGVDGLGEAADVVLSQDGAHLYAAGPADNAVTAFARDADTGQLTFLEAEFNGLGGVSGLLGASALAASQPDGAHLYVAGTNSNAVAVFARDTDDESDHFGELTFVEVVQDGVGGVQNLTAPAAVLAAESHVYVAAAGSNAVAVFARESDPGSPDYGRLTVVESFVDGADGVDGLAGAAGLAFSPTGDLLFVIGTDDDAVACFARDLVTGELTFLSLVRQGDEQGPVTIDALAEPSAVAARDDAGQILVYVTAAAGDAVAVFHWNDVDEQLVFDGAIRDGDEQAGEIVDGLGGAAAVALGDAFLYVAAETDNALTVVEHAADLEFVQSLRDGGGGTGPGEPNPSDWVLYTIEVNNLGPSEVTGAVVTDVFPTEFEDISWTCSTIAAGPEDDHTSCETPGGSGDLDETIDIAVGAKVVFSATGRLRPEVTGTLSNTATVSVPEGVIDFDLTNNSDTDDNTLLTPHADLMIEKVQLAPPVAGDQVDYVVTVTNLGPSVAPGNTVVDILPEALFDTTWSCTALPPPGLLEQVAGGCVDPLTGAAGVAVSGDGGHVYAVAAGDHRLAVFGRNPRTGALNLIETHQDGVDGVDGLAGPLAVALSPDGGNVYVAGELDDAVAVFERDPVSGQLTFLEVHRDGIGVVNGLGGVQALAVSPDGANLYAAGYADNAVAVFGRSATDGTLTFMEILQQGSGGVDGVAGAAAVAASSDGSHVYVAGALSDGLAVFARDSFTGALTFVQAVSNGDTHGDLTVNGLAGATGVVVSADGANVYGAGAIDDAVVVLERETTTGELTFVELHQEGVAGVGGLAGARSVILSSDGRQVYLASEVSGAIAAFARAADGALAFIASFDSGSGFTGLGGVRDLAASGDGKHLYAVGSADNALVVLARQLGSTCAAEGVGNVVDTVDLIPAGTAQFTITGTLMPGATGELVNTATVIPGATVVDENLDNNQASTTVGNEILRQADLEVSKDDGLLEVTAGEPITYTIEVTNNGPSDALGALVTDLFPIYPTETAGLAADSVSWICSATRSLVLQELHVDGIAGVGGLAGTSWVAVSPDPDGPGGEPGGEHVYVTSVDSSALSVFEYDTVAGAYTQVQVIHDGDEIDAITIDGLAGASGLAVSPDGGNVYAAGVTDNGLAVFSRDADPDSADFGRLTFVEAHLDGSPFQGLMGATAVALSPDGANVYVAAKDNDAVMVYIRDPASGALAYEQIKKDGSDDVPLLALGGARDIVVSPDGLHVYVASQDVDAVAVFRRDGATGRLSFVEVVRNLDLQGLVTVNGLDLVRSLAFSSGGVYLYAVSLTDDAVVVFERELDETSGDFGKLTFLEVYRDGIGGVDGLDGATAVALSPDGAYLYVASVNDDAVAVFKRDWSGGGLTPVEVVRDDVAGADGLDGAAGLAVSPDGASLFVTGRDEDALAIFERTAEGSCEPMGVADGLGLLTETVNLTAGASLTYVISATVDPAARGTLVNSAVVAPSVVVTDPDLGNNTGTDDDTEIVVVSDLGVTKDDGAETAIAGLPVNYTMVVTNAGPSEAFNVTVSDFLPASLVSCTCTRSDTGPCTVGASNEILETIDLEAGGTLTYTVHCLLEPGASGPLVNTVNVDPEDPAHDPDLGEPDTDNQAVDADAVVAVADLAVTKGNSVDEVIPGLPVAYTVVVTNNGPSDMRLGTVTDILPTQIIGPTWSCVPTGGAACTVGPTAGGTIVDTVFIPAGASLTYTAGGVVDPSVTGTITNTAAATVLLDTGDPNVTATDPDLSNNTATDADTLTPVADLSIVKEDDVDPVVTGFDLTYTITVVNAGPSWAHDAVVTETLPSGVTLLATSGCAEDPAGVPLCTLGDIADPVFGTPQRQYTVVVNVDEGTLGEITNQVAAASASADPNPTDDTTTEDTTVIAKADLAVDKVDSEDPVAAGAELVYTITVTNPGPYDATDVVVTDTLPADVTLVATSGCAEDPVGVPTCTLGTVAGGATGVYTITVQVDSSLVGTLSNEVDVATSVYELNPADNLDTEDTEVIAVADLQVTKDNGVSTLEPGQTVSYAIAVSNPGPSDAPAADVDDLVPPQLLSVSWTCVPVGAAACTPSGTGDVIDSVYLPAGDSVEYTLDATVDPALDPDIPVMVSNTATVTPAGGLTDPNSGNNSATDSDPVGFDPSLGFIDGFESGDTSQWSDTVPDPGGKAETVDEGDSGQGGSSSGAEDGGGAR